MFGYFAKFVGALGLFSVSAATAVYSAKFFKKMPGHGGGDGGIHAVPEIDTAAGLAAASILVCAFAIAREKFLRK